MVHEQRSPVDLKVTGSIPEYVAGTLYRTGPGGHTVKTDEGKLWSVSHWFDGFTQVHRFHILPPENAKSVSRVLYNSRSSVNGLVESIRKTGSLNSFTFAQKRDPCQSLFRKIMAFFVPTPSDPSHKPDGHNVGVTVSVNMPGFTPLDANKQAEGENPASSITSLINKTDASQYQMLNPETLEPVGLAEQTDLHPDLKGQLSATHAKSDPTTGDIFNYNLQIARQHIYRVFKVSAATGQTEILASITNAQGAAYLHSLLLTENYVILCVWNSYYAMGGMKLLYERNIIDALSDFDPAKRTMWYVIDRKHGKGVIAEYESDPFFCFHTINAWETPSSADPGKMDIMADLVAYDDLSVLKRFYYENLKSTSPSALDYAGSKGDSTRGSIRRFRLPSLPESPDRETKRKAVAVVKVAKYHSGELPTLNPNFITKRYRYVYGVTDRAACTFVDGLVKYDMDSHVPLIWERHGHSPGEAIFVPNPAGHDEDDGVLLSVVLDGPAGNSYLLCLDARTMKEVGRAELDHVVGFGFHGTHVRMDIRRGLQF